MNAIPSRPYVENQAESVQNFAREYVAEWSALCQQCLDFRPSQDKMDEHITMVKWLLRFARVMQIITEDPEYPDRKISSELKGRLVQLEYLWMQYKNPISEAESNRIAQYFPE